MTLAASSAAQARLFLTHQIVSRATLDDFLTRVPETNTDLAGLLCSHGIIPEGYVTWARQLTGKPQSVAATVPPPAIEDAKAWLEEKEILGEGGMGRVLRVLDHRLGREAACKILLDPRSSRVRARFQREVQITARLDHPAIPPVYEAGTWRDGRPYFLMKVIRGETLSAVIRRHHKNEGPKAGVTALITTLSKAAEAVAYAHSRGVVHRDLKPSNIMVGAFGEVMVMDWGIARVLDEDEANALWLPARNPELRTLSEVGTPGYMPPEQAENLAVDARADVFALGVILTQILTGELPIPGQTPAALLMNTGEGNIKRPRELAPGVPRELDELAAAALQAKPARRLRSAEVFADDLRAFIEDRPLSVCRYSAAQRLRRWARFHPAGALFLALAPVLLFAGLSAWLYKSSRDRARALLTERSLSEELRLELRERKEKDRLQRVFETRAFLDSAEDDLSRRRWKRAASYASAVLARLKTLDGLEELRPRAQRILARSARQDRWLWRGRGPAPVRDLALSADGHYLAAAGSALVLWDCSTEEPPRTIAGEPTCLAWLQRGDTWELACGDAGGRVRLLDPRRPDDAALLADRHAEATVRLLPLKGARRLISVSSSGSMLLHSFDGEPARVMKHRGLRALAYAPDTRTLYTAGDGPRRIEVYAWDLDARPPTPRLFAAVPSGVSLGAMAYRPQQRALALGFTDNSVQLIRADNGAALANFTVDGAVNIIDVEFAIDGEVLGVASETGLVEVRSSAGRLLDRFRAGTGLMAFALTADGTRAATAEENGELRLWNLAAKVQTKEILIKQGVNDPITELSWSADGALLAAKRRSERVFLWRQGSEPEEVEALHERARAFCFHPERPAVLCYASAETNALVLYNLTTRRAVTRLPTPGPIALLRAASGVLVGLTTRGQAALWHLDAGGSPRLWDIEGKLTWTLAVSNNGRWIAIGLDDPPAIRVIDTRSGEQKPDLVGHRSLITDLAFGPSSFDLASCSNDGHIMLWDVESGARSRDYDCHKAPVWGLDFSPDGRYLFSVGKIMTAAEGGVRAFVLSVDSSEPLYKFAGFQASSQRVAVSPNGRFMAIGGYHEHVSIRDLSFLESFHNPKALLDALADPRIVRAFTELTIPGLEGFAPRPIRDRSRLPQTPHLPR